MTNMLYCLLLLIATAIVARADNFMSLFIRDLAEHYDPTPLTLVHDEQDEKEFEKSVSDMQMRFCIKWQK